MDAFFGSDGRALDEKALHQTGEYQWPAGRQIRISVRLGTEQSGFMEKFNMHAIKVISVVLAGLVLATGCAFKVVTPGMSRDEVLASYGQPTRALPWNGGTRLQYSTQPSGQNAIMVDLDSAGKVVSAREVLTPSEFAKVEVGKWTRQDVEVAFGPPARVDHVHSWTGDIMTYRWRDSNQDMFFWVYLDPQNVAQRIGQGMELRMEPMD